MKKNELFSEILITVTKYFKWLVLVIVIFICFSGVRTVKSGEVAIILRFGKLVGETREEQIHEPGLLLAFPYIIDRIITVPTGSVMEQTVTTHYSETNISGVNNGGYVITGDQNIATISAKAKYSITDPISYALKIADISNIINAAVSNAMLEEAAQTEVNSILSDGKDAFTEAVLKDAQYKLDKLETGITLGAIELTNVYMPLEVKDIYDKVNSAKVDAKTTSEMALKYRENLIPIAEAEANKRVSDANMEKSEKIANAKTDMLQFWGLLDEYEKHPDVVLTRVYNEKISQMISTIENVRLVADDGTKLFIESTTFALAP